MTPAHPPGSGDTVHSQEERTVERKFPELPDEAKKVLGFFLEITSHCNMHCTFCPSDDLQRPKNHVDERHALEFLAGVNAFDPRRSVMLNDLGETFLNKKLFDYLGELAKTNSTAGLNTNLTLLNETNLQKLFAHTNWALTMSVQTPTDKSVADRGYDKIRTFQEYLSKACVVIEEKFRRSHHSRLEIHLALELDDNLIQSDEGPRLWTLFEDRQEYEEGLAYTIRTLNELAERMKAQHPEFYQAEYDRSMHLYKRELESGEVVLDFATLAAKPTRWDKAGWLCLPNVIVRRKPFGLWAFHQAWVKRHTRPGSFFFHEDSHEPFKCLGTHGFGMLSNGDYTLCCQDVEGQMEIGNIRTMDPVTALHSARRLELIENAAACKVCRTCAGKPMILDTAPLITHEQKIDKFGAGWHGFDPSLYGSGGRWTMGNAKSYFYTRLDARVLQIGYWSDFIRITRFRVLLSSYDPQSQTFSNELAAEFSSDAPGFSTFRLPVRLKPSTFYRLKLLTPSYARFSDNPDDLSSDVTRVGLAVTEMKLVGEPYPWAHQAPKDVGCKFVPTAPSLLPLDAP